MMMDDDGWMVDGGSPGGTYMYPSSVGLLFQLGATDESPSPNLLHMTPNLREGRRLG